MADLPPVPTRVPGPLVRGVLDASDALLRLERKLLIGAMGLLVALILLTF